MKNLNPIYEVTRLRRAVDNGEITNPKTIRMMKSKGWIPTKKKEIAGLSKGAENMLAKSGYKIDHRGNAGFNSVTLPKTMTREEIESAKRNGGQFMGLGGKEGLQPGTAYIPGNPFRYYGKGSNVRSDVESNTPMGNIKMSFKGKMDPMGAAFAKWHEAREAVNIEKPTGQEYLKRLDNPEDETFGLVNRANFGGHAPGTMRDEFRLNQRLKRRHGVDLQNDGFFKDGSISIDMGGHKMEQPLPASRNPFERAVMQMSPRKELVFRSNPKNSENIMMQNL